MDAVDHPLRWWPLTEVLEDVKPTRGGGSDPPPVETPWRRVLVVVARQLSIHSSNPNLHLGVSSPPGRGASGSGAIRVECGDLHPIATHLCRAKHPPMFGGLSFSPHIVGHGGSNTDDIGRGTPATKEEHAGDSPTQAKSNTSGGSNNKRRWAPKHSSRKWCDAILGNCASLARDKWIGIQATSITERRRKRKAGWVILPVQAVVHALNQSLGSLI